jgi:hypothetical protein
LKSKSIYRSHAGSHFFGTELADFGPVGNNEEKMGADYEQLLMAIFSCFHEQKNRLFKKNSVASAQKSC